MAKVQTVPRGDTPTALCSTCGHVITAVSKPALHDGITDHVIWRHGANSPRTGQE